MVVTEEQLTKTHRVGEQRTWTRRLGASWAAAIIALMIFEPVPSNANAPEPMWATVAAVAFLGSLGIMSVGLVKRQRWAFVVSGGAGVLGMFLAWACLATGHHLGAWWMIELGTFGALTALSITAAERSKS